MIRELFRLGPLSISPFGVLMVLAFAAAWAQLRWGMRRLGVGEEEDASTLLLAAGIGGIVGAKLYYAALYQDWRLVFSRSGLVWYGALLLGTIAVCWVARVRSLPIAPTADAVAPAVALGYAVGRIGCFLVGDDYGVPTSLPWGVAFPVGLPGPTTVGFLSSEYGIEPPPGAAPGDLLAVHPTQLYETAAGLAVWLLGLWMIRRDAAPGRTALWGFGLLAAARFAVELVRAKDDRFFGPLTLAQVLSLGIVASMALLALWSLRPSASGDGGSEP